MAVQQVIRALGSWSLTLRNLPQDIFDQLDQWRFGHIAFDVARENPSLLGDALLDSCRYAGVLISTERDGDSVTVGGAGMAFWLGSADKVGDVFETAREFTAAPFETVIAGLLPDSGAVTAGSIEAPTFGAVYPDVDTWPGEDVYPAATPVGVAGSYTGKHQWQSPREAIDYVSDLFGCDWRVNNNATLDAGDPTSLFVTNPTAAIVRRAEGGDQDLRGLPGSARLGRDVEDFSTRVINLAEGNGRTVAVGTADIDPMLNPYVDLHGNPVKLARVLSESNTSKTNADARAALALAAYTAPRDSLDLSTDAYDIRGDIAPGDSVWVYDPDAGLVNADAAVQFRGEQIHPVSLRVFSLTWPVTAGMGVYFRTGAGEWIDLTDWVEFEQGGTQVTVGGYDRSLTNTNREAPGSRVVADSSVPGVPALVIPFASSVYQSTSGFSRARITAAWTQPTNTDGTTIVDGNRYEVEYRNPPGSGSWSQVVAPFDSPSATIRELLPATAYGIRVRAVDSAVPPNNGAWSSEVSTTTAGDTIAPATPAAPVVAGNPVSIQVRHTLGAASGGTYNLAPDLRVLEVHASEVGAGFTPDATTKLGNLTATYSMLLANVPAIGTFSVASTATLYVKVIAVDESGNASTASAASTVTASLISDIYVSNVSATKLSAGDFTATYGVTGLMISGNPTGARFESGTRGLLTGMRLYRPSGTLALSGDASSGDLRLYAPNGTTPNLTFTASTGAIEMVGKVTSGLGVGVGRSVVVDPNGDGSNPAISLYPNATAQRIRWRALNDSNPGNGTSAPMFHVHTLSASGVQEGGAIETWDQAMWAGAKKAGSWRGGAVKLYHPDWPGDAGAFLAYNDSATGVDAFVGVESDGVVRVTADSDFLVATAGQANIAASTQLTLSASGQVFVSGAGNSQLLMNSAGTNVSLRVDANNRLTLGTSGSQLISGGTVKSFVIDHPLDDQRWLVHGCVEGPEAAVFYRGVAVIEDHLVRVDLPSYFVAATVTGSETVHLTPELTVSGGMPCVPTAAPTAVQDGQFSIVCPAPDGTRVHWIVYATRADVPAFDVEPLRADVVPHGDGPYRYLTPRENRAA